MAWARDRHCAQLAGTRSAKRRAALCGVRRQATHEPGSLADHVVDWTLNTTLQADSLVGVPAARFVLLNRSAPDHQAAVAQETNT